MSLVIPPLDILKTCAREMQAQASRSIEPRKLAACYEALAAELGARDWNVLSAEAKAHGTKPLGPHDVGEGQTWLARCDPYPRREGSPGLTAGWAIGRKVVVIGVTRTPIQAYVAFREASDGEEWEISRAKFVNGFYPLDPPNDSTVRVGQSWRAIRRPAGVRSMPWTLGLRYRVMETDPKEQTVRFVFHPGEAEFVIPLTTFQESFERSRMPRSLDEILRTITNEQAATLAHLCWDPAPWGEISGSSGEAMLREGLIEVHEDALDPDYASITLSGEGVEAVRRLHEDGRLVERDYGDRSQIQTAYPWPGSA